MSLRSRRKGKDGEREVVRLFTEAGYTAIRTAPMEAGGVIGDVTVEGLGTIEVKRGSHVPGSLYRWLEGKGARALMLRRDRCPWLVVMRWEDWRSLVSGLPVGQTGEPSDPK